MQEADSHADQCVIGTFMEMCCAKALTGSIDPFHSFFLASVSGIYCSQSLQLETSRSRVVGLRCLLVTLDARNLGAFANVVVHVQSLGFLAPAPGYV